MRKVVSPGGATKPAATFKVGDRVVLYPTAVMTISAIGKRSELTPADEDSVRFQPLRALAGESIMQVVSNDELVYALRFAGEDRDSFLLDVKATTKPPLRHISTKDEIKTFLALLGDELQNSRVTPPPPDVVKEVFRAGNDLAKLARLVPYLRATDDTERDMRAKLETLFVQEIAIVRGIEERDARAVLDHL